LEFLTDEVPSISYNRAAGALEAFTAVPPSSIAKIPKTAVDPEF